MVSDRCLLAWFASYCERTPSLLQYTSSSLQHLELPSLNIYASVIACISTDSVLDAMKLMSEQGVSSVAVIDDETGCLLSAVSVTDIGKVVVPSESKQILSKPLHQFVSLIKGQHGYNDGADKFPVFSVSPTSSLIYTMQKILATNAHRLFVTGDISGPIQPVLTAVSSGNICGIVSVVDILSLFARLANITDVDPTRMQRRRRASSSSSASGQSERDPGRSRSSSRTSVRRLSAVDLKRHSTSNMDTFQWSAATFKRIEDAF